MNYTSIRAVDDVDETEYVVQEFSGAGGSCHTPGVNTFTTHTGATRFGLGRFLLTRSDYDAIKTKAGSNGYVILTMTDGVATLTFNLVLVGALTHCLTLGLAGYEAPEPGSLDHNIKDMMEAVLLDKRCLNTDIITRAYNVQEAGLSVDSVGDIEFYSTTLTSGAQWAWDEVFDDTGVYNGDSTPPFPSTWKPRNLILDGVPWARALDQMTSQIGWIVGWDYATDKYTLWRPDYPADGNGAAMNMGMLLSGGTTQRNPARLPKYFDVFFLAKNLDSSDPFAHRKYVKRITNSTGNTDIPMPLHVGNYVAIYKDGAFVNQSEMDTVAADVAERTINLMDAPIGEYEFLGLRNVQLDGRVRGIQWISDDQGARTIVRTNDDRDFNPMQDFQRLTETISNQLVVGAGATLVGTTVGGTRLVWGGGAHVEGHICDYIGQADYVVAANTMGCDFLKLVALP